MKAQQVIYTSCRRGIDGSSSGFQNYSYSPQMKTWLDNGDAIGVMQSYQPPHVPGLPGLPDKEQAQTMYPRRQCFGPLDGPDHLYAMAMCSYIGRDYPEGSVRGGNFISHVLALPADQMTQYPCMFINSSSFLRWIEAEQVRSQDRPAPLESVDVAADNGISLDQVREFLDDEENAECFTLMLRCLLLRNSGTVRRKLLIRDSEENFALWVAALEYALPVRQSLDWGFSFYEQDPMTSVSDVIRAVDGMAYGLHDAALSSNFIFDAETGSMPSLPDSDADVDAFADAAVMALRYAPEGLLSFHRFLDATDYGHADASVALAYAAFQTLTGSSNMVDIDAHKLGRIGMFLAEHGSGEQRGVLFDRVIGVFEGRQLDAPAAETLMESLRAVCAADAAVRARMPEALVTALVRQFESPDALEACYMQLHELARQLLSQNGMNVDTALFDAISSRQETSLGLPPQGGVPWTVREYMGMVARSLDALLANGVAIPAGVSGENMLGQLGERNASAIGKIISVIVSDADAGRAVTMLDMLTAPWQQRPELMAMAGLLVLERHPSNRELSDAAIGRLWNVFIGLDEPGRILLCQAMLASGLEAIAVELLKHLGEQLQGHAVEFVDFLSRAMRQLPREFAMAHSQAFAEQAWSMCTNLNVAVNVLQKLCAVPGVNVRWMSSAVTKASAGVSILDPEPQADVIAGLKGLCRACRMELPASILLADQQSLVAHIAQESARRRSDASAIQLMCRRAQQQGARLPIEQAGQNAGAYVARIADSLASIVLMDADRMILQLFVVPPSHQALLMCEVFSRVVQTRRGEDILLLLACDAVAVERRGVLSIDQFIRYVAAQMAQFKVKASSLAKIVQDDKRMAKLGKRYEASFHTGFPKADFEAVYVPMVQQLEQQEGENRGLHGFLKRFAHK